MADSGRHIDSDYASPRASNTRPRTGVLLWIVMFVIVVMMVAWSITRHGTRSSAEPGAGPTAAQPGGGR